MTEGTGPNPKATDQVTVHYTGKLITARCLTAPSSAANRPPFLNRVIPGWSEGVQP